MAGKPGMAKYRSARGLHLFGRPQAEQEAWWRAQIASERAWLAEAERQGDAGQIRRARRWLADSEARLARVRAQQEPQTGRI
jgi:hypothetical protein